jgi:hypothetical protein
MSMVRRIRWLAVAGLTIAAANAGAQSYPRQVVVPPSDTVQLYSRSIFDRGPAARPSGRRVDYVYASRIAAADSAARHAEADRAAQLLGPEASGLGVRLLSIGLCDTRACAEGRSPPAAWYLYEHGLTGWRRVELR